MKLDVNGVLNALRQILGIASVLLATAMLMKLVGWAPRGTPGTIYELAACAAAASFASNAAAPSK
jgi:hypothetical protein